MLSDVFPSRRGKTRKSHRRRPRRLLRQVEALEDRLLLAIDTPILNFDGLPFSGAYPPDTNGDVGVDHYVQSVNAGGGTQVAMYNKSDGSVAARFTLSSLAPAGSACAAGLGDPIVLYDDLADRWVLTEFAASRNTLCAYISQTPDPLPASGYFAYEFNTPNFPDYPKYGVWEDAYYVSTNESTPAVYAFDRTAMLQGLPAAPAQRFTAPRLSGFGFQALIPADLDGVVAAPAGSPGIFMRHVDDEVHGGGSPANDILELWELRVDFAVPGNSTFSKAADLPIAEIDSDLCGLVSFFCIPQPGTTQQLDPLREVIMWRLQYRNFGTHQTLVGNLTTDVDRTDHAGIRWFELRNEGSGWSVFQEGTYAPDADHRWMGSVAMDMAGNIAIGYSVSSTTVFPSLRYVGRMATDPPGTTPQGEFRIVDGTGSQTNIDRWGDYSAMTVDPVDGCTFWYTSEYVAGGSQWTTRIASFVFDDCLAPPGPPPPPPSPREISGVKFNDLNANGARDADEPGLPGIYIYLDEDADDRIDAGEPAVITDRNGFYRFAVEAGEYTVREVLTPGWMQTFPASGEHLVTILPDSGVTGVDFGNTVNNDRGDAPAPYPTLAEDNGPSHGILPGMRLGTLLDGELDGLPDAGAEGDDRLALNDEDGVKFLTPLFAGGTTQLEVTVDTGGFSPAALQVWIDVNADGDWDDPGEQVVKDQVLDTGVHTLSIQVPGDAQVGSSFARFRYGYERGLGPTGHALAGEVEDYEVLVLDDVPVANDDRVTVEQDSINNQLLVLNNDFPSSAGPLRIMSVSQPDRGGLVTISPDLRSLFYTPATSVFSPPNERFTYGVGDGAGGFDSATVTVTINPLIVNPLAVDDSFGIVAGSQNNVLDVMANDFAGTMGALRLLSVTVPGSGAAVIDRGGTPTDPSDDVVLYTPGPAFAHVDQFSYAVVNGGGTIANATVTLQEQPNPLDQDVLYILETLDMSGDPVAQVDVGDLFQVRVSVDDNRVFPSSPQGVFAAYLDLLYERDLVSVERDASNPNGFAIQFSPDYQNGKSGNSRPSGIIDEVGAFQTGGTPTGADPLEVFTVTMRANAPGLVTFKGDPADLKPNHDTLLFDPPEPPVAIDDIGYINAELVIDQGTTPNNAPARFDVNRDGSFTPLDALNIVNYLNRYGSQSVRLGRCSLPTLRCVIRAGVEIPNPRLDVSGDESVSPVDVLFLINELNRRSGAGAEGERSLAIGVAPWVELSGLPESTPRQSAEFDATTGLQLAPDFESTQLEVPTGNAPQVNLVVQPSADPPGEPDSLEQLLDELAEEKGAGLL